MKKTGAEVPEYGTIQQRQAVGIFSYVDPKGRSPTAYIKVMKKYKVTREQVVEEASKLGMNIDENHFVAPEVDAKRGRPSTKKEVKEKGVKGRPKKEKKVLAIEGDEEDLFASLVAQANEESEEMVIKSNKKMKSEEEKEAERLEKEKAKAEKEAKLAAERLEKEAKIAAEKAEKEAKLAAEKAEREAKKETERLEKEAKKAAAEQVKKEKEEKLAAEKGAKDAAKKSKTKTDTKKSKVAKAVEEEDEQEEDEEPDVVKKIEFDGKKYLKSKKTGIVYDYNEYVNNQEQVVVGKWNDKTNKIDFEKDDGEESEEEYD
jgi:colicin import membrane protein